jgi:hypothetical protein
MNVLGIDFSSHAVDLVLADENRDRAEWLRVDLIGGKAFDRTREVRQSMPAAGWYTDHGVYLIALERPFSSSRNDAIRLVQGAVLACLPRRIEVWEVTQQQWKPRLGLKQREKPTVADLQRAYPDLTIDAGWPQDALDAAAMAFWARDLNAEIISGALAS